MFILLNGASDSLILFRFWNISHFLLSSFSEISNDHCLSFVAFPSLIALYHTLVKSNLNYAFPVFRLRFL